MNTPGTAQTAALTDAGSGGAPVLVFAKTEYGCVDWYPYTGASQDEGELVPPRIQLRDNGGCFAASGYSF